MKKVLVPMVPAAVVVVASVITGLTAGEVEEVKKLAGKYHAETEVRQWDGTRVDLLSAEYAIEADWAPKWAEAIGQSLYYAQVTDRKPAIILLVKNSESEQRYIYRCQTVCAKHDIKLFIEIVEPDG